MIEILGAVGTLLVLISFTQSNLRAVRIINMIGSVLFVVYGLVIHAYSTWILNACMIVVHGYKLYQERKHDNDDGVDVKK